MKKSLLLLGIPLILSATNINDLFDALKNHSQTKLDIVEVEKAKVSKDLVKSKLFPEFDMFASYDHYSKPTNIRPMPPTEAAQIGASGGGYPFSQDIKRVGLEFKMPLYVKSIYTLIDKTKAFQKSAKAKKEINLVQNEATIISLDANLVHLKQLKKSLDLKEKSILETKKTIQIKVNNGRTPKSALFKVEDALNQIQIAKNNIVLNEKNIISQIEALTGITLNDAIEIEQINNIQENDLGILKPLKYKIKASKLDVKATKENLYPTLSLHSQYTYSYADAYDNDKSLNEGYGDIGVVLKVPITGFNKRVEIQKAKVSLKKDEIELQKLKDELNAKAKMLKKSLSILDKSIKLDSKSVQSKQNLLKIAKVSFKTGRLTTEEYLRYEDDVVDAKAKLYQTQAQKWQTLMQLAVIYANNIEEMVK